jgi:hypothetical protein
MSRVTYPLLMAALASAYPTANTGITLPTTPPEDVAPPLPHSFVSYSFEFSSFPDFAGMSEQEALLRGP